MRRTGGVIGGASSFAVDGRQYVAVMAGFGGAYALALPTSPDPHKRPYGRVLVFRIDGTAKLPPYQRPVMPAQIVEQRWPAAIVAAGEGLYAANCSTCHGSSAYSSGVLPDLRRSPAIADQALFASVVRDGALRDRGMIGFGKWLPSEQVEAIRAFLAQQARALGADEGAAPAGK